MASALKRCKECGAEIGRRPTLCPLCGARVDVPGATVKVYAPDEVVTYQASVQELHDKLRKLREDAEAV